MELAQNGQVFARGQDGRVGWCRGFFSSIKDLVILGLRFGVAAKVPQVFGVIVSQGEFPAALAFAGARKDVEGRTGQGLGLGNRPKADCTRAR